MKSRTVYHIRVSGTIPKYKLEKKQYFIKIGPILELINDLIDENGHFISFQNSTELYGIHHSFLKFYGVLSAIPAEWKNFIKNEGMKYESIENKLFSDLDKEICNKIFYEKIVKKFREYPSKVQEKWKIKLSSENINFNEYYKIIHHEIKDTSLRAFQYTCNL